MKKIKRISFSSVFLLICSAFTTAVELVPTQELLSVFLEKDSSIQTAAINYQQAQLSNQKTQISNGFDINLSTGTIRFTSSKDNSSFTVSPAVSLSLPQASNLGISASSGFEVSAEGTELSDATFKVNLDIISSSSLNRKITLMQAQRKVLEAKRNFETTVINKEKEFYSTLSGLLNQISSIITKQQDLYDHQISFEEVKAKGYNEKSSNYRSANMKVQNDIHEIEKAERKLKNEYLLFYMNCGHQITFDEKTDYLTLIPTDIPLVDALDINSFNPEAYVETEKANWNHQIAELKREADRNFTLSANGGFTLKNTNTGNKSNTIDLGMSGMLGGISLAPGVSIPVSSQGFSPVFSLGVSVNPNKFRTDKIDGNIALLDERQELLNIETAAANLKDKITQQELELSNILWEKSTIENYYETYKILEEDMEKWYKQGIVTESKYLSAKVNREKYDVNRITNLIDMILYNDTISVLFYSDVSSSTN